MGKIVFPYQYQKQHKHTHAYSICMLYAIQHNTVLFLRFLLIFSLSLCYLKNIIDIIKTSAASVHFRELYVSKISFLFLFHRILILLKNIENTAVYNVSVCVHVATETWSMKIEWSTKWIWGYNSSFLKAYLSFTDSIIFK